MVYGIQALEVLTFRICYTRKNSIELGIEMQWHKATL